jgi:hypothetical protein
LDPWGCQGSCVKLLGVGITMVFTHERGLGEWYPRHMNIERANPQPFLLWIFYFVHSNFNSRFIVFLLWILSTFDFNIMITNSIFWPCDIEFVILPLWQIKTFIFYMFCLEVLLPLKHFHTLKQKNETL